MGRSPCCSKVGLRRGPWSAKEDAQLTDYIQQHGEGQWRSLPKQAGLLRCGKSCRLRWMNYLRPGIVRGNISEDEEDLIVRLHGLLGNRWSLIAGRLPGRTDNEIKNYWNTHLLKKLNKNKPLLMHGDNNNNNHHTTNTCNKNDDSSVSAKKRKKKGKAVKERTGPAGPNDPPKIKVYLPKPTRLSSSSSESLSRSSSDAPAPAADVARRPTSSTNGEGFDYLGCNIMALNELDQVYDEYLQQLLLI